MLDVIIALLPAAVASAVIFGMRANVILLACIVSAVLAEFLFNLITRHEQTVGDLSAVVTGLLLGLNLSTNVPIWQCVIGSVFAVVAATALSGGPGRNFPTPPTPPSRTGGEAPAYAAPVAARHGPRFGKAGALRQRAKR